MGDYKRDSEQDNSMDCPIWGTDDISDEELLKEFEDMNIIVACYDTEKLGDAYESIRDVKLQPYKSNQQTIISII